MGDPSSGLLCLANGPVSVPTGFILEGVYAKVVQMAPGDPGFPSTANIYPTGYDCKNDSSQIVANGNRWNMDQQLKASIAPSSPNNTLIVLTVSNQLASPFPPKYNKNIDSTTVRFTGVSGACTRTKTSMSKLFAFSSIEEPDGINPIDKRDGWLLYRVTQNYRSDDGSPQAADAGPILMVDGNPLSARVAAFYVRNMLWYHGLDVTISGSEISAGGVVRRPAGDLVTADEFCMFPGAPRNAVIISQPTQNGLVLPFFHVLMSETSKAADYVHLLPDESIRVQVNFDPFLENYRRGQFDLWVKIID